MHGMMCVSFIIHSSCRSGWRLLKVFFQGHPRPKRGCVLVSDMMVDATFGTQYLRICIDKLLTLTCLVLPLTGRSAQPNKLLSDVLVLLVLLASLVVLARSVTLRPSMPRMPVSSCCAACSCDASLEMVLLRPASAITLQQHE